MPEPRHKVRLDPWAAEYEGAIQIGEADDEAAGRVDVGVESPDWAPRRPRDAPAPRRAFFVDGVRRIEHRLLIEDGERTLFGLLGSFGVGATEVGAATRVGHETVGRVAVTGGGLALEPFAVALANGGRPLRFAPETVAENTPVATLQGLQSAMRRGEAALAERLAAEAEPVFLDGPLTFLAAGRAAVVGFVKRLVRSYLDAPRSAILRRLAVGERTPLFLIEGAGEARYSWYLRLGAGRAIDSALSGVVRLETSGRLELPRVREIADASARYLPRFASDAAHDPRAPQNLHPIGALEGRMRHLLGDHGMIRRAIEARLHAEVAV